MTLALFGGSFNPPHKGHTFLAGSAMEDLRPDRLIWMPSGDPPHKKLPAGTPSAAHRLEMSRIAAGGIPGSEVSDFEIRGGARYTIDTAEMLWEKYKPDRLWLIMGSDMADGFDTWHRAGDLRRMVGIYAVPRDKLPVSSTGFRETLDGEMLPPGVWEYIKRENLYKEERIRRN